MARCRTGSLPRLAAGVLASPLGAHAPWLGALLLGVLQLGAAPPFSITLPQGSGPQGSGSGGATLIPPATTPPPPASARQRIRTTPPIPGLGPRLAARLREAPAARHRFLSRGLPAEQITALGGTIHARVGPILAASAPAEAIQALAPAGLLTEAPQGLRPLLDVSRAQIGAAEVDRGEGLAARHRGRGALIAAYDTGLDLGHPDMRALDGPSRVLALWDQDRAGLPPPGFAEGHLCNRAALEADACLHDDPEGHGTLVLGAAASNGPRYRGIAPEADLLLAASQRFGLFLESLAWFEATATELARPMVVNLSLGGHEGPHDGTSLESQAIDAYPHLVVAAAGNDGTTPVHALARLEAGEEAVVVLRFPVLRERRDRRAIVEVWGDVGLPLIVQGLLVEPGGAVAAASSTISVGDPGRTEHLFDGEALAAELLLDAEAGPNPFNGQAHVRLEWRLPAWEDGPAFAAVRLRGEGRVDLWVDTPAEEPAPVRFDRDRVLQSELQVLGDTEHTISDLATGAAALAVSAYVSRTRYEAADGRSIELGLEQGAMAPFTSFGPSLSEATTGKKPNLAAPGMLVVAARSRSAEVEAHAAVSPLYRAAAGTSLAAPHVAGVAALLLGARPELTAVELRRLLLESADGASREEDPRWGAGRLDAHRALALAVGEDTGCGCHGLSGPRPAAIAAVGLLGLLWARRARRRRPPPG